MDKYLSNFFNLKQNLTLLDGMNLTVTFKSGIQLRAAALNIEMLDSIKTEMIDKLGEDRIIIK